MMTESNTSQKLKGILESRRCVTTALGLKGICGPRPAYSESVQLRDHATYNEGLGAF